MPIARSFVARVMVLAALFGAGGLKATADEAAPPPETDGKVRFSRVAPVLARHCLECHGSTSKKGRLDLSRKEAALAGGKSGQAIVPRSAADSLLWQYIESDEMPPKGRPRLSDEEKQLVHAWIDAGAPWPVEAIGLLPASDERIEPHREFEYATEVSDPGPILLRRLTVPEYIETVRSAVGVDIEADARRILPPDVRADGFSNTAYNLNVDLRNVEAYAELAQVIAGRTDVMALAAEQVPDKQLSEARSKWPSRSSGREERASPPEMRSVISALGKWLLRGPLEEHEVDAFFAVAAAVAREGGDFSEAVRYTVEAMLQSPRFVYCIENHRGDGAVRRVGDYELASRLSYILWGAPPDKELLRAADAGELSDRGSVEAQVRRMVEDRRAAQRSAQFVRDWLHLDQLDHLRPDKKHFPNWNEQLAADMQAETLAFFKYVAWEQKRPLAELMNAQVTFATPRLAAHYGLDPKLAAAPLEDDPQASASENSRPGESRRPPSPGPDEPQRVGSGLIALYTFREGKGDRVGDVSGAGEPIDLAIADASAVRWSDAGLVVESSTLIAAQRPPERLIAALRTSGAVTLEAWVTPANASQTGPARIVTLSKNTTARNFTLGQSGDRFETRLRTTATSANGEPSLSSAPGTAGNRAVHIVYSRDSSGNAVVYIDGRESERRQVGGNLSNWDNQFRFALANELSKDRAWQGTMHLVAVYDRALSADEVRQNAQVPPAKASAAIPPAAQPAPARSATPRSERTAEDLQVLYRFDEGGGAAIRDSADAGEPIHLAIDNASAVQWGDDGLTLKSPKRITSGAPPKRLIDAVKKSKALTLEAWLTPANTKQDGPARILTLSSGTSARNFTLGQEGGKFDVRIRATKTSVNGLPSLASPSGTVETRLTHVVCTRDPAGKARLYVDGQERAARDLSGDFSNWDEGFQLMLGNESTGDRPWQGTLHLVAVYSRVLTPDEVRSNYGRGVAAERTMRHGPELARYDLSAVPARGGLLTQGSVLTMGGDEASMVTRGLFVLHDVLSSMVEDPPPCVDTTPVPTKPGISQRAIAEARLADRSCSGCHGRFEPLAFGLEKFDGIGAFHERDEHGNQLRDDGEVLFPGADEPVSYQSSAELMDLLAASERVRQTLTLKVTQFALGRPLVKTDAYALAQIHQAAQDGGGTYASLITAIVMSDLVQTTRTEPDR